MCTMFRESSPSGKVKGWRGRAATWSKNLSFIPTLDYLLYISLGEMELATSPQRNYSLGSEIHTWTLSLLQSTEMRGFVWSLPQE